MPINPSWKRHFCHPFQGSPAMLLYFVILVSSRVSSRYHGQSSGEESNIGPPKNYEWNDVSLKDDQYRKKREIAEAILILIEDEIMIHNLIMTNKNTNTAMLEDSGQYTIKGENRNKKDKLNYSPLRPALTILVIFGGRRPNYAHSQQISGPALPALGLHQ